MRAAAALLLWCAALLVPASASAADPRLVPDVSSRAIDIQYSFTGEELLLFADAGEQPDIADANLDLRADLARHGDRGVGRCRQRRTARCRRPQGPDRNSVVEGKSG